MKTFKLHLIRHGMTAGNLQGLYIGSGTDIPLCDEGRAQLKELKERFEYPQVDTVFSSPLVRAVETANILFPNAGHQFTVHDLREAGFGVFENRPVKDLVKEEDFKKWITPGSGFVPEGAEPTEQFHARCAETLLKLFEYMIRMDVTEAACVTHGGVIMSMLSQRALPSRHPEQWMADPGCGYTVQTDVQLWMRDRLVEAIDIVPFGYADTLQEVKADDSPHMILADDSGTRYINASDKAFAGQLYFDRQRLIVGSVPCTFALLDQTGRVIYSKLPDTIPESELAALKDADTTTMRLCGQTLLLCDQVAGASSQRVWVWMVTALDTSSAYVVRTATLRQWFLLQAVLTLAALLMVHHTTALQQLNDRQSRFVADLTHELKTPLTSMIGYADLLRGGELPPENQRRAADAIYHESTRLESLSQQLLSLQDLRQEALTLTLTVVPVAAAFEDVARSLPDCPVTLEKTCPEDAAVSVVDPPYAL